MQVWWGKALEIWSHAVMSGRQRVDTQGAVHNEESQSTFLYNQSEGWRPEHYQGSINTVRHSCLPDVTTHDLISQSFPLRICILQAIKYRRWGWPENEAKSPQTFRFVAMATALISGCNRSGCCNSATIHHKCPTQTSGYVSTSMTWTRLPFR